MDSFKFVSNATSVQNTDTVAFVSGILDMKTYKVYPITYQILFHLGAYTGSVFESNHRFICIDTQVLGLPTPALAHHSIE